MKRTVLLLLLVVCLVSPAFSQVMRGHGAPTDNTPTGGDVRFYVDVETGKLYVQSKGSPATWVDIDNPAFSSLAVGTTSLDATNGVSTPKVAISGTPSASTDAATVQYVGKHGSTGVGISSTCFFVPVTDGKTTSIPATTASNVFQWIPQENVNIVRTVTQTDTAPVGCGAGASTFGIRVYDNEGPLELTGAAYIFNTEKIGDGTTSHFSYAAPGTADYSSSTVAKGHKIVVGMQGSGCSTWPTNVNTCIYYRTSSSGDLALFGDSITKGLYNSSMSALYPNRFIGNFGRSGEKTGDMKNNAGRTQSIIDFKAPAVVILGGTNDITGSIAPATTQSNLTSMVSTFQTAGLKVYVGTVIPFKGTRAGNNTQVTALNDWIKNTLGATPGVTVIDYYTVINADVATLLSSDEIHPTAAGYAAMAAELARVLGW